jgi:hypothetical protein
MSNQLQFEPSADQPAIDEICNLNWSGLTESDQIGVAWAYYYFSIQFRENLQIACTMYPEDENLERLEREECNTDNLSPYPGIAMPGERLNHDEFMRRALALSPSAKDVGMFESEGRKYLREIRAMTPERRSLSIVSYEDGGLQRLFLSILQAPINDNPLVTAFRFFMSEHIRFDSDPIQGHGALSRHITGHENIAPLWEAFRRLLLACTPNLQSRLTAPVGSEAEAMA